MNCTNSNTTQSSVSIRRIPVYAVRIFLRNGYEPMADLALGQGGRPTGEVVTIHWDNLYELEKYYISAYTFIYDVRPVPVANTFLSLVEQGQMANNHT